MRSLFPFVILVIWVANAHAQQLTITSPTSGTVVYAGGSISLAVNVTPATNMSAVEILGDLFDQPLAQTAGPFNFQAVIPNNATPGTYTLTAMGRTNDGRILRSAAISLLVDRPEAPATIEAAPTEMWLKYRGAQDVVGVYGYFGDETAQALPPARYRCEVENPSIVTVFQGCTVAAVSTGSTLVRVFVGTLSTTVKVNVAAGLRGDYDGDGDVDTDDVNWLTSWRNEPVTPTGDDRDLNSDGKIDALDSRVLTTVCTRPRCATE